MVECLREIRQQLFERIVFICDYCLSVKTPGFSIIKILKTFLSLLLYRPYVDIYLLKGINNNISNTELLIAFAGNILEINYISKLVYNGNAEIKRIGRGFIWDVESKIKTLYPDVSLIIIEIHKLFSNFMSRRGYFSIPKWINSELNLREFRKSDSVKSDIRRIKKFNYAYEITNSLDKIKYFYNEMYLPYLTKVYGNLARIRSLNYVKKLTFKGALLLVKRGNEYISGLSHIVHKDRLSLCFIGVKDANPNYIREGGVSAAYYYSLLSAQRQQFSKMGFGLVRPFLNDGLLRYKKKWNVKIVFDTQATSEFAFKFLKFNEISHNFLINNPFIFKNKNSLKALILFKDKMSNEIIKDILKNNFIPGIDELFIITLQPLSTDVQDCVSQRRLNHYNCKIKVMNLNRKEELSTLIL